MLISWIIYLSIESICEGFIIFPQATQVDQLPRIASLIDSNNIWFNQYKKKAELNSFPGVDGQCDC